MHAQCRWPGAFAPDTGWRKPTADAACIQHSWQIAAPPPTPCSLRPGPAGWEDGTLSFLDLPAVAAGVRFIERLGGFSAVGGG